MVIRVTGIIFFTTAVARIVFQGTTFALPKVFEEQLGVIATTATMLGWLTFIVFYSGFLFTGCRGEDVGHPWSQASLHLSCLRSNSLLHLNAWLSGSWCSRSLSWLHVLGALRQIPIMTT